MSDPRPPAKRPDNEERDRVMELLSGHFTAGRIELDDLERRMELAARAETPQQIEQALEGLRVAVTPAVREPEAAPVKAPAGARRRTLTFMSGLERRGPWSPAPRHTAIALMGGLHFDFREAQLPPGTTEVSLWVMWGGVEIIVPPDMDVEVEGTAIMGGLRELAQHPADAAHTTRRLRIKARVLMGGVDVKVEPR